MNAFMDPYICPQCGGRINRARMICEYCGTEFREENEPKHVIRIETHNPHVHALMANTIMCRDDVMDSPKEASEYAIRCMAEKFATSIVQFMQIESEFNPSDDSVLFRARLRVLDSDYRF